MIYYPPVRYEKGAAKVLTLVNMKPKGQESHTDVLWADIEVLPTRLVSGLVC